MELWCLDDEHALASVDNLYVVFYKQNYLLSLLFNEKMPKMVHVLRGIEINKKHGDNNNELLELLPDDAKLIIATGEVREVFEYLSEIPCIKKRFNEIYFYPSKELAYEYFYRKKYSVSPLKRSIVFCSGRVRSVKDDSWEFADNAKALFEYMTECGINEIYELIWIVKEPGKYRHIVDKYKNVKFLSSFAATSDDVNVRDEYYEALCLSEFLFVSQSYVFMRNARTDQIRIQLWHGCGFKSNQLTERQEKKYEYMTVTSPMYAELHARSFGLQEKQLLVTGLPKNDWLFSPINNWQEILDIPSARKYIFWLPTYRTCATAFNDAILNLATGLPIFKDETMLAEMNELLNKNDVVLVIKLHPSQDRNAILSWNLSNIILIDNKVIAEKNIDINQLLGHADGLISDYSSVATGYMLLDRPIAFTLDDYELYHGFHWPREELRNWLPGEEIFNYDDFARFVQDVSEGKDTSKDKRHRLMPYFHKYTDGNSCKRVLDAFGISKD